MKQFRNMLYPYVVWLFIMVLVPMLMILLYAFTTAGNEVTTFRFTLDNFSRFLTDTVFLDVLKRSLLIAVVTTVVCVLLGYPIAYTIAKGPERSGFFWIMLITLPTWINMLVRTYAWVGILQDDGLVNRFLGMLGIGSFHMLYTTFAVVLGMVYNYLPYMILPLYSVMVKIDRSLIEAGQDLGCNSMKVLVKIIVPLSLPGIMSGITMVFVPAISTFIISRMLGGGGNLLIGDLIEMQFLGNSYNPNLGAGISLVLMVIILLIMTLMNQFDSDDRVLI